MNFRNFNGIRVFIVVARYLNMGQAAEVLHLTKGAVSYQIQTLEDALGFALFERSKRKLSLTKYGDQLLNVCDKAFADIEHEISRLQKRRVQSITIGMATYFASRWLSPRLMKFMALWPAIDLRINPLIDLIDVNSKDVDVLIRWGKGDWSDPMMTVELLLKCPAMVTASIETGERIERFGIESVLASEPLLYDRNESEAWTDWFLAAGIDYQLPQGRLVIQDPNVRAQAVIDGQGLALYDDLINYEVNSGRLYQYQKTKLDDYGFYLVYPKGISEDSPIGKFRNWILSEARTKI